jgi:hypothetical protein
MRRLAVPNWEFVASAPEELNIWIVPAGAALPFLPAAVHGKEVIVLPIFIGEMQRREFIAPLHTS